MTLWILLSFFLIFLFFIFYVIFINSVWFYFSFFITLFTIGICLFLFEIPVVYKEIISWMWKYSDWLYAHNSRVSSFLIIATQNLIFIKMIFVAISFTIMNLFALILYFLLIRRYFITVISYNFLINYGIKTLFFIPFLFFFLSYVYSPFVNYISQDKSSNFSNIVSKINSSPIFQFGGNDNQFVADFDSELFDDPEYEIFQTYKNWDIRLISNFIENWESANSPEKKINYLKQIRALVDKLFPPLYYASFGELPATSDKNLEELMDAAEEIEEIELISAPWERIKIDVLNWLKQLITNNFATFFFVPNIAGEWMHFDTATSSN